MMTVTFFDTDEELLELTGIPERLALWDEGFNLDDWDFGFVCDQEWHPCWGYEDGSHYFEEWLLNRMECHCVGYEHTEYNGKHYYMAYHS